MEEGRGRGGGHQVKLAIVRHPTAGAHLTGMVTTSCGQDRLTMGRKEDRL